MARTIEQIRERAHRTRREGAAAPAPAAARRRPVAERQAAAVQQAATLVPDRQSANPGQAAGSRVRKRRPVETQQGARPDSTRRVDPIREAVPAVEPATADLLYGATATAKHLGITKRQVLHLMETGRLPHFRVGRAVCARRSTLNRWLDQQEAAANG